MQFAIVIIIVAVIAYLAFVQWLQLTRRTMIHQERLAVIEKGVNLPPLEQETRKGGPNRQQFLLLAGLIWISVGVGAFAVLSALLAHPTVQTERIPQGIEWISVAPVCIGVSHLIVYMVGRNKEN